MFEMIGEINEYYRLISDLKSPDQAVVISTSDEAWSTEERGNPSLYRKALLETSAFNFSEAVKCLIKGRKADFRRVTVIDALFEGSLRANLRNGTALILGKEYADKFYFKDLRFYEQLHNALPGTASTSVRGARTHVFARQKRFRPLPHLHAGRGLLAYVEEPLSRFHSTPESQWPTRECLAVPYKVRQLFGFYCRNSLRGEIQSYLEVAHLIESVATSFPFVLCHGDLWRGNILEGGDGRAAMIDFDKALAFCRTYDFAYFYLMEELLPRKLSVREIVSNLRRVSEESVHYLSASGSSYAKTADSGEMPICILLVAWLKQVEHDLRHDRIGYGVPMFREALGRMVAAIPEGRRG